MKRIKRFLKYGLLLILIVGIGVLQSFSNRKNERKIVSEIAVDFGGQNPYFLSQAMVNKLLIQNGEPLTNQAKSELDLHNLESKVTENSYVDAASVFMTITGELKTTVVEKKPIARFIALDSSFYIDSKGFRMPLSDNFTPRVILVSGAENTDDVIEMTPLLNTIYADDFLKKELIGVELKKDKEIEFKVRSGDYSIKFGRLNDIDIKFNKLKAFYNKSFNEEIMRNYKNINLKYHNQVVCTK